MLNHTLGRSPVTITDAALTAMGRRAYDDVLGNLRARHNENPDLGENIRRNRCITDMLWLLRIVGQPFELTEDYFMVLRETHGFDDERIADLQGTMKIYENGLLTLNDERISGYLQEQRLPVTNQTLDDGHGAAAKSLRRSS